MLEFAVKVSGLDDQPRWVLAIDPVGERVLLAYGDDNAFHWHPLSDCTFTNFIPPDQPRPVIVLQPEPGIVAAKGILDLDGRRQ